MTIKNNDVNNILIIILFFILQFSITSICKSDSSSFEDGVIYLSRIIADEKYPSSKFKDQELVDSLYIEAVRFYKGDISEALLALTFATLPFNKMHLTIPLLQLKLSLSLPSVSHELFERKKNNIPGAVFFDSPKHGGSDKDKISHFFGNAFLAYNIRIINLSKFLGLFVEVFESVFKVSGKIDFRDISANYLGEFFGYSLRSNPNLRASDFLNVYSLFYFSYN